MKVVKWKFDFYIDVSVSFVVPGGLHTSEGTELRRFDGRKETSNLSLRLCWSPRVLALVRMTVPFSRSKLRGASYPVISQRLPRSLLLSNCENWTRPVVKISQKDVSALTVGSRPTVWEDVFKWRQARSKINWECPISLLFRPGLLKWTHAHTSPGILLKCWCWFSGPGVAPEIQGAAGWCGCGRWRTTPRVTWNYEMFTFSSPLLLSVYGYGANHQDLRD